MTTDARLLAARARSMAARARLDTSIAEVRARLSPKSLARDAVSGVTSKAGALALDGVDAARTRPVVTVAAVGAIGLLLARKPLARWIGRRHGDDDATASVQTS